MIDVIFTLVRKAFETDERSRKFAVQLADSYLRRIRRFQDQLVLLGITLNSLAAGFVFSGGNCRGTGRGLAAGVTIFLTNILAGKLYANEHRTTKLLFARYPELELVMEGDKSWSNSRILVRLYKYVQAAWLIYTVFALLGLWTERPVCW